MDRESLVMGLPYAVVLVIAPVALILDHPVVAIAAGTLGLVITAAEYSHLALSILMTVTFGEMMVGVLFLLPGFAEFRDALRLGFGIVWAVVWLFIFVNRVTDGRAKRRSDVIEQSLDNMPLAELVPRLIHVGFYEGDDLERRIMTRLKTDEAAAVSLIIECYRASKHEGEKSRLIKALGGLSGDEAMKFLKHLLVNEKNSSLLRQVVRVSGRAGRADMVSRLARLADVRGNHDLGLDALEALGQNGTPEAFDSIRWQLARIEDPNDRYRAVDRILDRFKEGRPAIAWLKEVVREDGNPVIRARAAWKLSGIRTPESLGALNEVLAGDWGKELCKVLLWQTIGLSYEFRRAELDTLREHLSDEAQAIVSAVLDEELSDVGDWDKELCKAILWEIGMLGYAERQPELDTLREHLSDEAQAIVSAVLDEELSKPRELRDGNLMEIADYLMADWS